MSCASHLKALQQLLLVLHQKVTVLFHNNVCHEQKVGAQAGSSVGALALQPKHLPVCCRPYQRFQGPLDLLLLGARSEGMRNLCGRGLCVRNGGVEIQEGIGTEKGMEGVVLWCRRRDEQ